jgi:hypothetical protein
VSNIPLEEKINTIGKKYGVKPIHIKESIIDDILKHNYHRLEVINIVKRGKPDKFAYEDMSLFSTDDLRNLAGKYTKRIIPSELSRNAIVDILLGRMKVEKLSDNDLKTIGRTERATLTNSLDLYAGWIPKVHRFIKKGDLDQGKSQAKYYKKK